MRRLLLLIGAAVIGCGDPTSPTGGIVVTAVLGSSPTMRVGSTISIPIEIRNASDEHREVTLGECEPPFEVLNQSGEVVGPNGRVCTLEIKPTTPLAPGGSLNYTSTWQGDSNTPSATGQSIPVPAGSYFIRPRVHVVGVGYAYGNPVPLTITP